MKISLITILMLVFVCYALQAQSIKIDKSNGEVTHLISLKGEDQHGHDVRFAPPEEKPLLIFFLPKTESRAEAIALMDEVTGWFESMDGHFDSLVSKILVVEPYRTGPLINRLFRSKLKDKSFQVIRDPEGEIVRMVHQNHYSIILWLTDRKGNIMYKSFEPFSELEFLKIKGLAGSVTVQN